MSSTSIPLFKRNIRCNRNNQEQLEQFVGLVIFSCRRFFVRFNSLSLTNNMSNADYVVANDLQVAAEQSTDSAYVVKCKACLFTWPHEDLPLDFYDKLTEAVQSWPVVEHWAITEELTKTKRPHFHLYIIGYNQIDRSLASFAVQGFTPRCDPNKLKGSAARVASARGLFYVVADKIGTIRSNSSDETNGLIATSFRPQWAKALVSQGKMDIDVYKKTCLEYSNWSEQNERDFVRLRSELSKMRKQHIIREVDIELSKKIAPFRKFSVAEQFMSQYNQHDHRFKFLVIVGESMTGKSKYAQHLFKKPFEHTNAISWTGYDDEIHDGVIFHDVHNVFRYILNNRDLFQASNRMSKVNTSAANAMAFDIYLYRKPIVVVCNWDGFEIQDGWIRDNCHLLQLSAGELMYKIPEKVQATIPQFLADPSSSAPIDGGVTAPIGR